MSGEEYLTNPQKPENPTVVAMYKLVGSISQMLMMLGVVGVFLVLVFICLVLFRNVLVGSFWLTKVLAIGIPILIFVLSIIVLVKGVELHRMYKKRKQLRRSADGML